MSHPVLPGTAGAPDLAYQDLGRGPAVVLIHGWPLSQEMWEYQTVALVQAGLRVVTYDRRGFGRSGKPWQGYDYDVFADDLKAVLDALDLQGVTLVGFSMGGGEVARYMSRHGGARVARAALVGAVTPYLLKTEDNPDGIERSVFDGMVEGLAADRPGFLAEFGKAFYGVGPLSHPVSAAWLDWTQRLALAASPFATLACVRAFSETDFRADLLALRVPTLIVHGGADATVPPKASAERTAAALPDATYKRYDGAPHGLFATHRERLNGDLIAFASGC